MAVITLDDGSAQVELTVFNEEYEKSRQWIVEDELLVVEGKASLDEYSGNIRVSGEELFNFAQARSRFARQLELQCNSSVNIARLKEILKPWSEGECAVQINYTNGVAVCQLRLGADWQVTLDDALMRELGALLQPGNLQVIYG